MSNSTQPTSIQFSPDDLVTVNRYISEYPQGKQKSAILPVLHLAQKKLGGYLSAEVMDYVASLLQLQPIEMYEVATFYTMFRLNPCGKYVLEVCQTGPCALLGAEETVSYLESKLGISVGQTTSDGLFTLKTVECLASCGTAPVMQVGDVFCENLTNERLDNLIAQMRAGTFSTEAEVPSA